MRIYHKATTKQFLLADLCDWQTVGADDTAAVVGALRSGVSAGDVKLSDTHRIYLLVFKSANTIKSTNFFVDLFIDVIFFLLRFGIWLTSNYFLFYFCFGVKFLIIRNIVWLCPLTTLL